MILRPDKARIGTLYDSLYESMNAMWEQKWLKIHMRVLWNHEIENKTKQEYLFVIK